MSLRWKIAQSFEKKWWQYYLKNKPKAEYLKWKKEYWEDFLRKIEVQPSPASQVADIGCGPAGIFMNLSNCKVEAIDPLLDNYKKNLSHFNPKDYPYVNFQNVAFEDYTHNHSFDYTFCLNAINHVDHLSASMDQLVKITKPGGTIILSIDAHNYDMFKIVFKMIPGDILHPHQYDLNEYRSMLTQRNCTIQRTILFKQDIIFNYYVLVAQKTL